MNDIIVIKIGTNALMKKDGGLNTTMLKDLVKQINHLKKIKKKSIILVSSGAVGIGRLKIKKISNNKISPTESKQFFASIGQPFLMQEYQKIFEKYDVTIAQALLTRSDFAIREKYISMRNILTYLIENDIVPIINENDVLSPEELDFSDNDQLSAYVAGMMGANKLIILSDVKGLYDRHPSEKGAQKIDEISIIDENIFKYIDNKKSSGGTGGMGSKIETAKMMLNLGIEMNIASSEEKQVLIKIIKGENIGTLFKPLHKKNITGIRRWLSTGAYPKGRIFVSTIISDLLKKGRRSSILATGIENIKGNFEKGDVIEVLNEQKQTLGYGISKLSSKEIKNIIEDDKEEKKDIIVIHTDYFLSH